MPTPASAVLLVALNGGAPTSGGITAANGDTVQLSAQSTTGWTQQRYDIYSFYSASEFPLPAGWSLDAPTGAYVYSTSATPPPFTLPAGPAFGKWLLRLTANNGLNSAGAPDATLIDSSTALTIPSAAGLSDLAWDEEGQFSAAKKWVEDQQANLRVLEAAVIGAATPGGTVSTVLATAGTAGALATYSRSDHRHQVSTAAPSVTVKSDASSAAVGTAASVIRTDAQLVALTDAPSTIGTANAIGSSTSLPRADHVHAHGAQTDGSLHALAVPAGASGFLSGAFATDLTNATSAANASTLVKRDVNSAASFAQITASGLTLGQDGIDATGYVAYVPFIETYAASIAVDGKNGNRHDVTLTGNVTFGVPINYGNGSSLELFVEQGAAAPYTAAFNATFVFSAGLSGTLLGVAQFDVDVFEFKKRSAYWVCVAHTKHVKP